MIFETFIASGELSDRLASVPLKDECAGGILARKGLASGVISVLWDIAQPPNYFTLARNLTLICRFFVYYSRKSGARGGRKEGTRMKIEVVKIKGSTQGTCKYIRAEAKPRG